MAHSQTEENYLKAVYTLMDKSDGGVNTTTLAKRLDTKASSVTDMIKKLADKKLVDYKKYQGVTLTAKGKRIALSIIRKHRLWEVFLLKQLKFKWDEVHVIAEQLEHVQSEELTKRLAEYLGNPKFDPHGDPIPDENGKIVAMTEVVSLSKLQKGDKGTIISVKDSSSPFLQYLEQKELLIGTQIEVSESYDYDNSKTIIAHKKEISLSEQVCDNLILDLR